MGVKERPAPIKPPAKPKETPRRLTREEKELQQLVEHEEAFTRLLQEEEALEEYYAYRRRQGTVKVLTIVDGREAWVVLPKRTHG
jgi:CTP-dependent riboflavin kinase